LESFLECVAIYLTYHKDLEEAFDLNDSHEEENFGTIGGWISGIMILLTHNLNQMMLFCHYLHGALYFSHGLTMFMKFEFV